MRPTQTGGRLNLQRPRKQLTTKQTKLADLDEEAKGVGYQVDYFCTK